MVLLVMEEFVMLYIHLSVLNPPNTFQGVVVNLWV